MGIDRKNYVMSPEIAMAREMAFRNKLQSFSSNDPIHSQVYIKEVEEARNKKYGFFDYDNNGYPVLLKASANSGIRGSDVPPQTQYVPETLGLMQNQRPGMPPGSMLPPFPQAHTNPCQIWRPTNPSDQKKKGPINHDRPAQLGNFYCLLCQIDCTTSHNLMMHYQGQKHMAKLLGGGGGDPKGKKVGGPSSLSAAKDRLYCKLCGIWCKDEFTFRSHLQCKNHILTLQEFEKNMKKPGT